MEINILCVGNSFAVDVSTYVHQIAKSAGHDINIYVLYIPGCPIDLHYKNFLSGEKQYEFYENGGRNPIMYCSIHEGLNYKKWDYITFQQRSGDSGDAKTFFPELPLLMEGIRKNSDAKFLLHMTWSYAKSFSHERYGSNPMDQEAMDRDIFKAYDEVSKLVNVPYIIPTGKAIRKAREKYGDVLDRDGYHLSEMGRALAGILWNYYLLGLDIDISNYLPTGFTYDDVTKGVNKDTYLSLIDIAKEVIIDNKGHNLYE